MNKQTIINLLMEMQDDVYKSFKTDHALLGDMHTLMILTIAEKILRTIPLELIDKEIQDAIECNNCHLVGNAIDVLTNLRRFDCHEFMKNPHNIKYYTEADECIDYDY